MIRCAMMKIAIVLLVITWINATPINYSVDDESESDEEFDDNWMDVPLDHFNLFDDRTWKMRYFINEDFFRKGNPLFIEVGGEWTITGNSLLSGQLHELAKKHHGLLIEKEHRYYGQSLPFGTDFSTENLKFLQIEQALEDLAYFIDHMKSSIPGAEESTVVLHGCSYPGMLVTWMRLRFPHLVDISYASSAPLGVGLDYPEYYEVVNDVYANISGNCIGVIRDGFRQTEKLLKTKKGRKSVKIALKNWSCGSLNQMNSLQILSTMLDVLNTQYDPVRYEEISCRILSMGGDDLEPYQRLAKLVVQKSKDIPDYCGESQQTEEERRNGIAWNYQTCTEMGTFQTLNRANSRHPFAMDSTVEESVEQCANDYGEMVTEQILRAGVARVTRRYGGKKPKVTKVISVQGTTDPWKYLSVLEDFAPEAPLVLIEGSHCVDVTESKDDPEELIRVRRKIRKTISDWIKEIA